MATIGLDRLYYAKITENDAGEETYGTPSQLAKAISADLSVELAEATLYADDGASEIVKEFKSGTLSLGIDDIGSAAASDLTGATIDKNKVLISASEDGGDPVAVGFRAKKSNGKYKYYWLYRVKFGIPATNLATKGDTLRIYCYCRDASIYLADIMITEGAIPRKWTPAPNEIYTQEVKIDKRGIEVSNSASSQRTVITNTEFAGYYNDEVIFTLNKDETQTKKTTVDGELTVGKTKFVPMPTASEGLNIVILD